MFKLQPNPTFKTKVGISVAGQESPDEIEVEFKYLSKPAVKAFFDALKGKDDVDALAEIMVGWSGTDHDFSPEALSELLDNYAAAAADIFWKFRHELLESKTKNS